MPIQCPTFAVACVCVCVCVLLCCVLVGMSVHEPTSAYMYLCSYKYACMYVYLCMSTRPRLVQEVLEIDYVSLT